MASSVPAAIAATSPGAAASIRSVNTDGNPRIPILLEMVAALSRAGEPQEVLEAFSTGIQKLEDRPGYVSLSTRGLEEGRYRITRLITEDFAGKLPDGDPWRDGAALPVHESGFLGQIVRRGKPQIFHHVYLREDPAVGDALSRFGSLMAIPLFDNGAPLNWAIMLHTEPDHFTVRDLEESTLRANLVGSTVRNVLIARELRAANERAQREVDRIARIQRALLPEQVPDIPGVSIGTSYETFDTAGGDIYDFAPLRFTGPGREPDPHGPWGIHIADAAGHGPAAATVVAMLNAILHASPDELEGPGQVLAFANHHLVRKRMEGTFVTAILARYDPCSLRLTYARAGHNPAIHMAPGESGPELKRLDEVGGVPLGVIDDVVYEEATVQLRPGQTLVLYTDGITEATNPAGVMFGVEGIERSLTTCSGEPDCVIGHVTGALTAHEAGERPKDDQTIVVMRLDD